MTSIKNIQGLKTVDTSPGRANDIVQEIESLSSEINNLTDVTEKLVKQNESSNSPYLKDHASFNPLRLKDSVRETDWKKVSPSFERELESALESYSLKKRIETAYEKEISRVLQNSNRKKLNII